MSVSVLCPVRACGETLDRLPRVWRCPRGHSFDRAKSGYCNLLQPQDRRSARPGDSAEAVAARRRLAGTDFSAGLHSALRAEVEALGLVPGRSALDVGCGEGSFLGPLAGGQGLEAYGVDLSLPAIELAARRFQAATWIVANADRALPFAAASFDLVVSIDARLPVDEIRRVLRPSGALLLAVPAPEDLIELRRAVLGDGEEKDRFARSAALLEGQFKLDKLAQHRSTIDLSPDGARDALLATYRGGRASRSRAIAALPPLRVTLAHEIAIFRPRQPGTRPSRG